MPSFRRQKGVITRAIPDWNSANVYYGQIQNGFVAAQDYTDGFTNLESDGSSLILWDCTLSLGRFTAGVNVIGTANWGIFQLPPPGLPTPFAPIDPIGPNILSVTGHNYNTGNFVTGMAFYTALSGEGIWQWPHDWPMAIVRPGFTFFVNFTFTNAAAGMGVLVEKAFFP